MQKYFSTQKLFFILCSIFFGFIVDASAAILTVTTAEDSGDDVCNAHCSLREAIKVSAHGDTIIFARSVRGATIQLQTTLVIDKDLRIDGPNRRRITLKGNRTFRILYLADVGKTSIDGLIIQDGAAPGGWGGGIRVRPGQRLTLSNCVITDNHAVMGGGIWVDGSAWLELLNTTVANNTSDGEDGAAGIQARHHVIIRIFNSTITGNRASNGTGGIQTHRGSGVMELINTTVSDNHSSSLDSSHGGGISSHFLASYLLNTIVAGNSGATPDVFNAFGENNFIGNYDGPRFIDGLFGNIVGTAKNPANPRFGPLSDNGGGLPTYALLPNSRAINAGNNDHFLPWLGYPGLPGMPYTWWLNNTDQRGFERFVNTTIDMGAVEYGGAEVSVPRTILGRVTNAGGRGLDRAMVTLRNAAGETKSALTNPFGYYRFTDLPVDAVYTVEVSHKRAVFQPQSITTEETQEYLDFTSVSRPGF